MNNKKRLILLSLIVCGWPQLRTLSAMEIPLESFGKGAKIAYVNMHKIFEAFPETERARVELNRTIEDKRSEISARKEEIAKLKAEVDFIRKQNQSVDPSTASKSNLQQKQEKEKKKEEQKVQAQAPEGTQVSTETQPNGVTSLTLPEGSPMGFLFSPPKESTDTSSEYASSEEAEKNRPVKLSTAGPQILPGIPSLKPQLQEKEAELTRKQSELEAFVGAAEEEVKNLEEGKTMTLLARIYKSLEDIASKEGYTIIVDKDNILYGEGTVDITQNVIWRLSGTKSKGG